MKINITARDRKILFLGAVALVVSLVYLAMDSVLQGYREMDTQIAKKTEELTMVSRLRNQYLQTHSQLQAVKTRLDGQQESFSLLSFIEDLAKTENIREKFGSVKPKTLPMGEHYEEKMVEIQMDDVTLAKLVDFIYKMEHSGHVLKVKRLRIKPRFNNRDLLSVVLQVSTFSRKI